ncbi:hypothetical protein YC2023_103814 [Brassica napus]
MDRKLAHKLSLQGKAPRDALNMYDKIIKMKNVRLDARFHTVLIDSLVEIAIRLFNRSVVEKHPLDVVSYTVAVKGLVRGRRMDEACSLLYKMKGLIGLLSLVCARREIRIG